MITFYYFSNLFKPKIYPKIINKYYQFPYAALLIFASLLKNLMFSGANVSYIVSKTYTSIPTKSKILKHPNTNIKLRSNLKIPRNGHPKYEGGGIFDFLYIT